MELIIKWKAFRNEIQNFVNSANDLLFYERESLNQSETNNIENNVRLWIRSCEKYLKTSFNEANNELVISFQAAKPYSSYLQSFKQDKSASLNNLLDELNTKKKTLEYYLELLSISDAIIQPKLIDVETRANYTRREMMDLVLDKLYHLYNQKYYPIQRIFAGNALKASKETVIELVAILEQKGYIQVINNRSLLVQLSIKGKKYIEDKRNFDLITRYTAPKPEIEKLEYVTDEITQPIHKEAVYSYYKKTVTQ